MFALCLVTLMMVARATYSLNSEEINALKSEFARVNNELQDLKEASNRVAEKMLTTEQVQDAVGQEVDTLRSSSMYMTDCTTLMSKVDLFVGQDVPGEVREVKSSLAAVVQEVERLGTDIGNISRTLEEVSNSVQELAALPPPPPTEDEEEYNEQASGAVYPCMDSTFPNGAEICPIAVQFNKCRQTLPSYHCCHTCTTGGHLPEMGEWRHLNLDRNVTANQLIYFFSD